MGDATPWRLIVEPAAEKDLKRLPPQDQTRIRRGLDRMLKEPRRADLRKLRGREDEWRLRVGDWRVRLRRDSETRALVVLAIRHRREAYR